MQGASAMALFRLPSSGPAALAPRGYGLLHCARPQMSGLSAMGAICVS